VGEKEKGLYIAPTFIIVVGVVKSLLERSGSNQFFQFSSRRVLVSGLMRPSEADKPAQ